MRHRKYVISALILVGIILSAVLLRLINIREKDQDHKIDASITPVELAAKHYLVQDLPKTNRAFNTQHLSVALRTGSVEDVERNLGTPSDRGQDPRVLSDAIRDRPDLQDKPLYYFRYRYPSDTLVVLVFSKESDRVVHYFVRSWTTID